MSHFVSLLKMLTLVKFQNVNLKPRLCGTGQFSFLAKDVQRNTAAGTAIRLVYVDVLEEVRSQICGPPLVVPSEGRSAHFDELLDWIYAP